MGLFTTTYTGSDVFMVPLLLAEHLVNTTTADRTTSQFLVKYGSSDTVLIVKGTGFSFDSAGIPTSGYISSIEQSRNGASVFTFTDLNVSAKTVYDWIRDYDPASPAPSPIFFGDDRMYGGAGKDNISGGSGHDVISGGENADYLLGGDGNDHIYGQSPNGGPDGDDDLNGGAGNDYIQGNAGADIISGGPGSDRIFGGSGDDRISADSGSRDYGNDTVNGNVGNDTIEGGGGNDLIRGGQGEDRLDGGPGDDVLMGDKGNDYLIGGGGVDQLTGGEGRDGFFLRGQSITSGATISAQFSEVGSVISPMDVITDFVVGEDFLGLGTDYQVNGLKKAASASDLASAVMAARHILENNANGLAAIQVGSDTYVFMKSFSEEINVGVELMNVSAEKLVATESSFGMSYDYTF